MLLLLGISPCEVLELVPSFPTSPSSSKTEFVWIFYCVFEFGGFIGSLFRKVSHLSFFGILPFAFLGFYSLYLIELVLSFSKSPSLLK